MVGAGGDENCQCRAMGEKEKNRRIRDAGVMACLGYGNYKIV